MVHSVIGPSSAKTILSCRPSLLVPPVKGGDGDNAYTTQGNAVHDLIELCGAPWTNRNLRYRTPEQYIGQKLRGITVDAEMARDADMFLQEARTIMDANP